MSRASNRWQRARLLVVAAVTMFAGCQRRAEPVTVVALASGARFDVPRGARAMPAEAAGEHSFALAEGNVLVVTEESLTESCDAHIEWAINQARQGVGAGKPPGTSPLTAARGPERITVNGRSGVRIGLVAGGKERVDMLGLCAGSAFVIFQVAQRGNTLDPALDRLLVSTAGSLRAGQR